MMHPLTTKPSERARTNVPAVRTGRWLTAHPVLGYVLLAYLLSWPLWVLAYVTGSFALVVLGGFGPAGAAAVMLRLTGQSLQPWLRGLLAWRVRPRFYAYALALPAAVYGLVNLTLQALGTDVDWSLLPGRVPGYLLALALTSTLFGGLEEPGWRGYALPRLQDRHTPFMATTLLGLAWGVWHVPLYGPAGFVVPLVLAFFYTWLFNRTGSVLLCVLLHGSFTAAQDELLLTADSLTVDAVILGTYLACAGALVLLTKGRLGKPTAVGAPNTGRPRGEPPGAVRTIKRLPGPDPRRTQKWTASPHRLRMVKLAFGVDLRSNDTLRGFVRARPFVALRPRSTERK